MTVRVYIITGQPRRMRPNKIYETQRMDNLKKKHWKAGTGTQSS